MATRGRGGARDRRTEEERRAELVARLRAGHGGGGLLVPRRHVLGGIGGALGAAAFGCGDSGSTSPNTVGATTSATGTGGGGGGPGGAGPGGGGIGGTGASGGTGSDGGMSGGGAGAGGQGGAGGGPSCTGSSGMSPEELLANIETIVVLYMENRSFDHYFGSLSLEEGLMVDGLTGMESNLDSNGMPVAPFHLLDLTPADPPHGWDAAHAQWNMGKNDGFVIEHAGPDEKDVMGYYVRDQLPASYALADSYVLCERWFCSLLGPTFPNRYYLHGATSNGVKSNLPILFGYTSIFDVLSDAGVTWKNYFHDLAFRNAYGGFSGNTPIEQFFDDAAAGTLPQFCMIDPQYQGNGANDDHPDHDVTLGQALISAVYAALAQSPQWSKCLFVVSYDENGGVFDHVPPPVTVDDDAEFAQLGFRVPAVVAGPFVRKGCVVSTQLEHVSVISTLTKRFGLPPLNQRVSATNDLSVCIDPAYLKDPQKPAPVPRVDVSMRRLTERMRGPVKKTHPELHEIADQLKLPTHLDRRKEVDGITERVLAQALKLGAVRFVP